MALKHFAQRFFDQCRATPTETAFLYFDNNRGDWAEMSWAEYGRQVQVAAGWLKARGIGRGDKIAILSANRPEWLICDIAIASLGAISVPIYATSSQSDVEYVLEHSETKVCFVDNQNRAAVLSETHLGTVVVFDNHDNCLAVGEAKVFLFQDILQSDTALLPEPIAVDDDDVVTIIYTSGTTGRPKGAVHTHGNFKAAMEQVVLLINEDKPEGGDRLFSFLPLSHVAERVLIALCSVYSGTEVAFARSVANLSEDLVRFRPTIILCVPRLWEKMYEKIVGGVGRAPFLKRAMFNLGVSLGSCRIRGNEAFRSRGNKLAAALSDKLVGQKLREKLGLDRARMLLTGSAPTRNEVMKFFASFGLFIREVYGLTENLCLGVLNDNHHIVMDSCGKPFRGNEMKLAADKEILFRAPWNFKGYYKNEEATQEVLTADGWFATGDLGSIDDNNYLRIVGRKKELLKTSTGKYVAPVPIEDKLKALSVIADAMVVGDNQKYCVALVSLELEELDDPNHMIISHLTLINRDLANHESIKRVGILEKGFSVEEGTLTPTLKLKRKVAAEKHAIFIDRVYQSSEILVYQR